ncbi:MAG TPA: hypothetical protein ENI88_10840 [Desulfobulbus sp.]|nr:hypothetical protein [Desulfobulbus sp.]
MKWQHLIAASLLTFSSLGVQASSVLSGPDDSVLYSGNTATIVRESGAFTDSWSLNVNETTGWANISIGFSDIQGNLAAFSLNIDDMDVSGDLLFDGSNDSWIYTGVLANDSSYAITVAGTANGSTLPGYPTGAYSTAFIATPTAAPVPIPPAAVLFGSALVGLAALRRKKGTKESIETY